MADVKTEIDSMLDGFGSAPVEDPPSDPPVEDPPVVDPPVEEPPVEEPPVELPTEPPVEPPTEPLIEPPTEPPAEPPIEPPAGETPEQLTARLEAQNKALLERIESLSGAPATPPTEPKPVEPPVEPAAPVAPPTELKVDEVDFLQGRKPDDLIDDPALFNKLLNEVYRKGVEAGVPLAMERSLLAVPQVVVSQIQRNNVMKGLVDDFYKVNVDLKPVQRTVGMVANEVHSEHTDWTVQQVFDEAAIRTRKVLGMPAGTVAPQPAAPAAPAAPVVPPSKPGDPAFANVSGSRQRGPAAPRLTGMAKEIEDLM